MVLTKFPLLGLLALFFCVSFTDAQSTIQETDGDRYVPDIAENGDLSDLSFLSSKTYGKGSHTGSKGKRPLCATCRSGNDCKSGKCWGSPRKCVQKTDYHWLTKCGFKKECESCSRSSECATKLCKSFGRGKRSKCIFRTKKSVAKCFRTVPKPSNKPSPKKECAPCKSTSECARGKCYGSPKRCVRRVGSKWLKRCGFKTECKRCRSGLECATRKCDKGFCVRRSAKECEMNKPEPTVNPGMDDMFA